MLKALLIILITTVFASAQTDGVVSTQLTNAQRSAWQSIEDRWKTWQAGDLKKMLTYYDPTFGRWNSQRNKLDTLEGRLASWEALKKVEKLVSLKLEPVSIEVHGDSAAIHYISYETVTFTAEAFLVTAGKVKAGEEIEIPVRWSEFLVKKKGKWLFIGGSRDGTCSIFKLHRLACNQ